MCAVIQISVAELCRISHHDLGPLSAWKSGHDVHYQLTVLKLQAAILKILKRSKPSFLFPNKLFLNKHALPLADCSAERVWW